MNLINSFSYLVFHFMTSFLGKPVEIKIFATSSDFKNFNYEYGVLTELTSAYVVLDNERLIPMTSIRQIKLDIYNIDGASEPPDCNDDMSENEQGTVELTTSTMKSYQ